MFDRFFRPAPFTPAKRWKAGVVRPLVRLLAVFLLFAVLAPEASLAAEAQSGPTFTVTKPSDSNDGLCAIDDCSLREAILAANAAAGTNGIDLPAGTYTLSLAGANEDGAATGDLDISGDLTLVGAGAQASIIEASGLGDRVFHVQGSYTVSIQGLTFQGGNVSGEGGGLFAPYGSTVSLDSVVVDSNSSTLHGGGLKADGGLTILNSTLSTNYAGAPGGALDANGGTVITIRNSTFSGNFANGPGGAIGSGSGSDLDIENSTFSSNHSNSIGGAIRSFGTVTLNASTLTGNSADGAGGALYAYQDVTSYQNSIIAGNYSTFAPSARECGVGGTLVSNGHNVLGDSGGCVSVGSDLLVVAANVSVELLNPTLALNGSLSTPTHALLAGSPAIDAGDPMSCPATDQRGEPRVGPCDIGAFEFSLSDPLQSSPFVPTLFADENDGACTVAHCSLREAVRAANAAGTPSVITLAAGSYPLSLSGADEDGAASGDLDLTGTVTINGAGSAQSTVTGDGSDRVFHVRPLGNATLNALTVSGGQAALGGGILNEGSLAVADSVVSDNQASSGGSAIHSIGAALAVQGSSIHNNADRDSDSTSVAAIRVAGGSAQLHSSVFYNNDGLGIDRGAAGVTPNGSVGVPLYPTLTRAFDNQGHTVIQGRLPSSPMTISRVEFFFSESCDPSGHGEGEVYLGGISTRSTPAGVASLLFVTDAHPDGGWISALATNHLGDTSEFSGCTRIAPANDSWTTAHKIDLIPGFAPEILEGSASHFLDSPHLSRWYKIAVQPGSQVQIKLSDLPANYDLLLYRDIATTYEELSAPKDLADLALLNAEFAPDAFAPDQWAPDVFSPDQWAPDQWAPDQWAPDQWAPDLFAPDQWAPDQWAPDQWAPDQWAPDLFAPDQWAPDQWAPDQWAPDQWAPDQWAPDQWAPDQWAPDQWAPDQWAPDQWAPDQWAPDQWAPDQWAPDQWAPDQWADVNRVFTSAQTRSVLAASGNRGQADETLTLNTWEMSGDFYIRVRGHGGAFNVESPFSLDVTLLTGACGTVTPLLPASTLVPQAGAFDTLILSDLSRMAGSATEEAALSQKLSALAARPEVNGVVVDVASDAAVAFANDQADASPSCPFAKNLLADAIKKIVDDYRARGIQYVVLVGNDDVIPFYRYPDQAGLANESNYVPPVLDDSASQASLRLGYVLSQDGYGSSHSVTIKESELPLPDLAVGRLVETPSDVMALLDAYLSTSDGVVHPTSSLVTGYDFLEDAAQAVESEFQAGLGAGARNSSLIAPNTISPSDPQSWSAAELRDLLLDQGHHDLIYLAGHFSAFSALAADFETRLLASEVAASDVDLRNAVILSAGCHAGYNIVNKDGVPGVTVEPDWPQAFAQKGALLIAGTGYQYGDTDFVEYSERLYLNIAQQLRVGSGPVAVGKAMVEAKQQYLAETAQMRPLHEKAFLEATLFGLPMLRVDMPAGRTDAPGGSPLVTAPQPVTAGPGAQLELTYSDLTLAPTLTTQTQSFSTTVEGAPSVELTYLEGANGIATNPAEPVLPLERLNVGVPNTVLRGVGFRGGSYTDLAGIIPLTSAPTTELRAVHVPFASATFYPIVPWRVNYFDLLSNPGSGNTYLMLTPAQFRSDEPGSLAGTLRRWDSVALRFFYSDNITSYEVAPDRFNLPALAAPPAVVTVQSEDNGDGTLTFEATVLGAPTAGVQAVWVTFTAESGPFAGQWQSLDLTQPADDSRVWRGTLDLQGSAPGELRYLVQAVNGVGLVALDSNRGGYYTPDQEAAEPVANPTPAAAPTTLVFDTGVPSSGIFGTLLPVGVTLSSNGTPLAGEHVTFELKAQRQSATTDATGHATIQLPLSDLPGPHTLQATFAGSPAFKQVTAGQGFTITKQSTTLSIDPAALTVAPTPADSVVATLRDGTGRPLREKAVLFTVSGAGGSYNLTAITDYQGRAALGALPLPSGDYTIHATFAGVVTVAGQTLTLDDARYQAASADSTLTIDTPPVARAGGPHTVIEGGSLLLDGSASSDLNLDPLTYSWDVGGDGIVEATTITTTLSAAGWDGPSSQSVTLTVCDPFLQCATDTVSVTVENAPPTVTLGTLPESHEGSTLLLSPTVSDPAASDLLTYSWSISRGGTLVASGDSPTIEFTPADDGMYDIALQRERR